MHSTCLLFELSSELGCVCSFGSIKRTSYLQNRPWYIPALLLLLHPKACLAHMDQVWYTYWIYSSSPPKAWRCHQPIILLLASLTSTNPTQRRHDTSWAGIENTYCLVAFYGVAYAGTLRDNAKQCKRQTMKQCILCNYNLVRYWRLGLCNRGITMNRCAL
jgi:hypothetical protein